MSDKISMYFTEDEIQQSLAKVIKSEHVTEISKCLTQLLGDDSTRMEILFKATMGIVPTTKYKKGEIVICEVSPLSTWRFDKEKMKEEGLIKDECMTVKLIKITPYGTDQYKAQYTYINEDGKTKTDTSKIRESYIKGYAEELAGD